MDPQVAFGITASGLVLLVMQLIKYLGLDEKYWRWAQLVLSVAAVGLAEVATIFPQALPVVEAVVAIVIVFGLSTGLYTTTKAAGKALGLTRGYKVVKFKV